MDSGSNSQKSVFEGFGRLGDTSEFGVKAVEYGRDALVWKMEKSESVTTLSDLLMSVQAWLSRPHEAVLYNKCLSCIWEFYSKEQGKGPADTKLPIEERDKSRQSIPAGTSQNAARAIEKALGTGSTAQDRKEAMKMIEGFVALDILRGSSREFIGADGLDETEDTNNDEASNRGQSDIGQLEALAGDDDESRKSTGLPDVLWQLCWNVLDTNGAKDQLVGSIATIIWAVAVAGLKDDAGREPIMSKAKELIENICSVQVSTLSTMGSRLALASKTIAKPGSNVMAGAIYTGLRAFYGKSGVSDKLAAAMILLRAAYHGMPVYNLIEQACQSASVETEVLAHYIAGPYFKSEVASIVNIKNQVKSNETFGPAKLLFPFSRAINPSLFTNASSTNTKKLITLMLELITITTDNTKAKGLTFSRLGDEEQGFIEALAHAIVRKNLESQIMTEETSDLMREVYTNRMGKDTEQTTRLKPVTQRIRRDSDDDEFV